MPLATETGSNRLLVLSCNGILPGRNCYFTYSNFFNSAHLSIHILEKLKPVTPPTSTPQAVPLSEQKIVTIQSTGFEVRLCYPVVFFFECYHIKNTKSIDSGIKKLYCWHLDLWMFRLLSTRHQRLIII